MKSFNKKALLSPIVKINNKEKASFELKEGVEDICKNRNLKRQGNHIYFYDYIDDESQLWLQQAMNDAYEECIIENAKEVTLRGTVSDNIYLHINSYGGSVVSSLALYDFIKNFPQVVVGIVEGVAASGASILLCACQLREMTLNSSVLIHELLSWYSQMKKWQEIQDDFENNKYFMDKIKSVYIRETNIPPEILDDILKHDIYWDTAKCKEYELCDIVVGDSISQTEADKIDKKVEKRINNSKMTETKKYTKKRSQTKRNTAKSAASTKAK